MSLEIGDACLRGLKVGGGLDGVSGCSCKGLVTAVLEAMQNNGQQTHKVPSSVEYKEAFSSVLTLLLEAARQDASSSDLTQLLEECGWPSAETQQLATGYCEQKDALRGGALAAAPSSSVASSLPSSVNLSTLSTTAVPSVIDVQWRLDAFLRSDTVEAARQPTYIVNLSTNGNGHGSNSNGSKEGNIQFACNLQQMQDLLAKLKDAQRQIQQRLE